DHPARFIAEFVDALDRAAWIEIGIGPDGEPLGAPAYHPRALLCVWLHGFMTGIRSSRKLEAACRDQVHYLYLTGRQNPDHNTLWQFYQAHRDAMRKLLKYTVATAVELDLIDLAVQAVDGTKIAANAADDRTHDAASLQRLLNRAEAAIAELEAQNEGGDDAPPPRLPEALQTAKKLHQHVKDAMNHLGQQEKMKRVNLTDGDAQLMKGRSGIITGYNAQAMVSTLNPETAKGKGLMITAVEVVNSASDSGQLAPMLEKSEEITGQRVPITLADGGYHTVAGLEAGARRNQTLVMTERYHSELQGPYFKDNFIFNSETDSYTCPHGHQLLFRGFRRSKRGSSGPYRVYRASRTDCRTCLAFGVCTRDKHAGRALWISSSEELLRKHRQWMSTDAARSLYSRRQEMSEPTFGILKEQMNARRFLLRGLVNVRAEFNLLATAFNLRTLWRIWSQLGISCNKVNVISGDNQSANVQIHRLFGTNHGTASVLIFA
ncbi:MAG: IS1182 family transposase, partial [Chloroflexi bacterium]|nr:IS1182 family transposase [Chloroflexota bacterium]